MKVRFRKILFLLLFLIIFVPQSHIEAQDLKKEDLLSNIPREYDKLLEAYKKVVDLAFTYKKLYESAEASNTRLLNELEKVNERLKAMEESLQRMDKTIEVLQSVILKLLGEGRVSAIGIYNLKDGSFSIGASYKF